MSATASQVCHRCEQPIVGEPALSLTTNTGPRAGTHLPMHMQCLVDYFQRRCTELEIILAKTGAMLDESEKHCRALMRELGRWSDEDEALLAGSKKP